MNPLIPPGDPLIRILYIDLSRLKFWVSERNDLLEKGLGGAGLGIQLLREECPAGADPLGGENPIILAVGPLVGYYPLASKAIAMFKSPHTGNLGESHAGGRSAMAIRMAGYGAIVIRGRSERPLYISIEGDDVQFHDASALWGMRSSLSVGSVLRQRSSDSGLRTILRIGRAGERLISYATVNSETYRHFGRLGLGAVFGSKKLKAVIISGKRSLLPSDTKGYRRVYDVIYQDAIHTPLMKKYHELGTSVNVSPLNAIGALPTRNLQGGSFEKADAISGESLAANFLGRRLACAHCPVACIHLGALRLPYPHDPYFYKTIMVGYDHELIYSLGSMLGIGDVNGLFQLLDEVETQGLDAMTTGVVLAWATEAFQKGLVTPDLTGDLALAWGDWGVYIEAVRRITAQPNDFYRTLGHGVDAAAQVYGGEEYALSFGGNEMPGYHTGPGGYLGYLTGSRHSHLDSAGYSIDQKAASQGEKLSAQTLADSLVAEERWRQVLTSLSICLFARNIYTPERVVEALNAVGYPWSTEDLSSLGKTTLAQKYAFKCREGFRIDQLRLPARIFKTPAPAGPFDPLFINQAIQRYRELLQADVAAQSPGNP